MLDEQRDILCEKTSSKDEGACIRWDTKREGRGRTGDSLPVRRPMYSTDLNLCTARPLQNTSLMNLLM